MNIYKILCGNIVYWKRQGLLESNRYEFKILPFFDLSSFFIHNMSINEVKYVKACPVQSLTTMSVPFFPGCIGIVNLEEIWTCVVLLKLKYIKFSKTN